MRVRLTVTPVAKVPSAPFRVGGQGKPVRNRRGPATVTGDATRTSARAPEPLGRRRRSGKARDGRPGSQETCPDRKAHIALVERGGFMLHRLAGLALAVLALLVPASLAAAAPVTVNVRIEGATQTLFEGPVTTDAKASVTLPSSQGAHPCNVGENLDPNTPDRLGNAFTATLDAAAAIGAPLDAGWFANANAGGDFFLMRFGPDTQTATQFWGLARNFQETQLGGCETPVNPGDEVLWAFDLFSKHHLLQLTGPASATVGTPTTVHVVDGQNGAPMAGASVGGTTTDAAGNAQVTFAQAGVQRLKAEAPDSVRSNQLLVSVAVPG